MLKKIIASLVAFVVLILTFVFSLGHALLDTYLNPDFYQDEVVITEIYDVFTELLTIGAESAIESGVEGAEALEYVDIDTLVSTVQEALPPEYITEMNAGLIDQFGQDPLPEEVVLDLKELKEKLPEAFSEIVTDYMNDLEVCTDEQLSSMDPNSEEMPNCMPDGIDREGLVDQMWGSEIDSMFDGFPDEYLISTTEIPDEAKLAINLVINKNQMIKTIIIITYVVLLTLIALIIFKPLKSVCWWVGNTLFWGALPMALINVTMGGSYDFLLPKIAEYNDQLDLEAMQRGVEIMTAFTSFITDKMFWHGVVLASAGAVLMIAAFFLPKKSKKDD